MFIFIKNNQSDNFIYFIYENTLFYFNYLFQINYFKILIISFLQHYFIDILFSI
jgi:hypothetical protein